jgi:hypothetical protein
VPYLAAILMSLASALPLPARLIGTPKPTRYQAPESAPASEAAEIP